MFLLNLNNESTSTGLVLSCRISERKKRFSVSETFWTTFQLTYKFHNYASKGGLTPAKQRSIVLKAFTQWENISPFSFSDVTGSSSSPDITIS